MVYTATLTKAGQITIPKAVRQILGLKPGQTVTFHRDKDTIRLEGEKSATEIAHKIDELIPDDIRDDYMKNYAGLTSSEMQEKWLETPEAKVHFKEERKRSS